METFLQSLTAWEGLGVLALASLTFGLFMGLGVNLAGWIIQARSWKSIQYDNLDKN